jgi:hypothetical protein
MRSLRHVLIVAIIGLTPLAARAAPVTQTITETFSLAIPPTVVQPTGFVFSSTPFPKFAPSTGTLDDVTVMLSGSRAISPRRGCPTASGRSLRLKF